MNQATQALQTIAELRAENRGLKDDRLAQNQRIVELLAENLRYRKALREIAGQDSGVWGRIAHATLRGLTDSRAPDGAAGTLRDER